MATQERPLKGRRNKKGEPVDFKVIVALIMCSSMTWLFFGIAELLDHPSAISTSLLVCSPLVCSARRRG